MEANEIYVKLTNIVHFYSMEAEKKALGDSLASLSAVEPVDPSVHLLSMADSTDEGNSTAASSVAPPSSVKVFPTDNQVSGLNSAATSVHNADSSHMTSEVHHHPTNSAMVDTSSQTMPMPTAATDFLSLFSKPKVVSTDGAMGLIKGNAVTAHNFDAFNSSPTDSGRAIFPSGRKFSYPGYYGSGMHSARDYMAHLPNGFYFAHFNSHFEVCPGIYLASHSQLVAKIKATSATKLSHSKLEEMLTFPAGLRYCFKKNPLATYSEKLSKAPAYLKIPEIEGFEPMMFPSSFKVSDTVNLISGEHHMLGSCIKVPFDVVLLQMLIQPNQPETVKLPTGLTILEVSDILKIPEHVRNHIPKNLELVQINSVIDLPSGVEVSPGVVIVNTPDEYTLPYNLKFVNRSPHSVLNENVIPVISTSKRDKESLFAQLCMDTSCVIKQKPEGFDLGNGVEVIWRPQGHPVPAGATTVPLNEYPEGLESIIHPEDSDDAFSNLELIRLAPRFDFPVGCKLSSSWNFFPRPVGMRLPSRVHIVYPAEEFLGISHSVPALPSCVCRVAMPDIPYNVKLPQHSIAVELLFNWNECCLPEGALLAPGVVVLNPTRFVNKKATKHAKSIGTCNALLVFREPNAVLPDTVEKGSSNDMPNGIGFSLRLKKGMEIVKVPVRFELPPGLFYFRITSVFRTYCFCKVSALTEA